MASDDQPAQMRCLFTYWMEPPERVAVGRAEDLLKSLKSGWKGYVPESELEEAIERVAVFQVGGVEDLMKSLRSAWKGHIPESELEEAIERIRSGGEGHCGPGNRYRMGCTLIPPGSYRWGDPYAGELFAVIPTDGTDAQCFPSYELAEKEFLSAPARSDLILYDVFEEYEVDRRKAS